MPLLDWLPWLRCVAEFDFEAGFLFLFYLFWCVSFLSGVEDPSHTGFALLSPKKRARRAVKD